MSDAERPEFSIDVGGTFTDCLVRFADGRFASHKLLSSGVTIGSLQRRVGDSEFVDPLRQGDPPDFWLGYEVGISDAASGKSYRGRVIAFDCAQGSFTLESPLPDFADEGAGYQLHSGEAAPISGIRYLLGIGLQDAIPPCTVRLGTTKGTNALLTRSGARSALVTTRGFADVLEIGYQDRPRLFDIAIEKRQPLYEKVVEVNERIAADGTVLQAPDEQLVQQQLTELKQTGVESLAICLLHAYAHPRHEQTVERIAREAGFTEISTSSRIAPSIKIVARGDTTVVDAYLNPVLRQYIAELREALAGCDLKLMTSSGGLIDADHFSGKDSVLSGPAGGVIGLSGVAQGAGFSKSIGFAMGGTSTDVARFDGEFAREYETMKAGVRIVAPMLAIETVAAGGGSICRFDGVKLTVGPASAGADPGPACYGRGGPLTVTDMNLQLGRILPEHFPFPLDRKAVEKKLTQLCRQLGPPSNYTPSELAEGFIRIANANMVRAIRNMSLAKGYAPQDHLLVTFGGAGAQHACAISRELGIKNILVHPWAGILSAYGIGLADTRRFAQSSVLEEYNRANATKLESVFAELEQQATAEVLQQGVAKDQIERARRTLDMRYFGAEAAIDVPQPDDGDYVVAFEKLHQQLFGFVRKGQSVEVVAARVEVVGRSRRAAVAAQKVVAREAVPGSTKQVWFDGAHHETGIFQREDLHAGDQLVGPAIVCEVTSTIVIEPGFTAEVTERGELLIRDVGEEKSRSISSEADPVMLEVFNNQFASIAEQMGTTLRRTAFSTNVKERLDFSCAIFSPAGELVANAPHVPVHLGAMGETVRSILSDNPNMQPGDVFVTNDPFRGGSHLPDVTVVTPIHDTATGKLIFFSASRAHHAEIGGITPGSLPPMSKTLADEGVLIQGFKLMDAGESREAALRRLLLDAQHPTRAVDENMADIAAQVAANHRGAALLGELVASYALPVVHAYMDHIQQAAADKVRLALAVMPDGVYQFTDHLDDGSPVCVQITITGDAAVVDFTGTGPVIDGNLNANRGIVTAAVMYTFRCLLAEDIPLNGGVLSPVEIILPECLLNPPAHEDPSRCAAVVGGNVETSSRVVDVLFGALGLAAASQGTMNNFTFGDDTFGYYETIGGGSGATADADGASAVHTHMTNTRLTDPEVIEHRYPVRIRAFRVRRGSGGAGKRHGGDGIIRQIEFLRPLKVSLLTERRGPYAPFGLEGGSPGALGVNTLQRAGSDEEIALPAKAQIEVQPGDVLTNSTPGGGGFGCAVEAE